MANYTVRLDNVTGPDVVSLGDGTTYATLTVNANSRTPLVADPSPELGGDLNTNGHDVLFGDNDKAIFGAGSDLQIYHSGTHSFIDDAGQGNLYVRGNSIQMGKYTGEIGLKIQADDAVTLYHDNAAKLATTSTGIDVTGTVTADGLNVGNDGQIYFASTAARIQGTSSGADNINIYANNNIVAKFASGGDISFYEDTGTAPKLTWSASAESLGIGTSSPSEELHITAAIPTIRLEDSDDGSRAEILYNTNSGGLVLRSDQGNGAASSSNIIMAVDATEAMRIDSSGNVLVGTATSIPADSSQNVTGIAMQPDGQLQVSSDGQFAGVFNRKTSDGDIVEFRKDGAPVGSVSVTASATAYNTSSDYRLKTDAQPMTGASARVQALKPVNFEWIADGTRVDGFLAHEAQAVVPESVTGMKDAVDAEGNPEYQAIDQSKLVPLLTAALQEALTKIDTLETRITALEG